MEGFSRGRKGLSLLFIIVISLLIMSFVGCTPNADRGKQKAKETLVIADPQWDSVQFHNAVVEIILENGYNYNTEIISGSTPATFTGLVNGDIDIYMEAWVQNIQEIYDDAISSENVIEVSTNFDDNKQGLYVPTYVIKGDPERGIEAMAPDLKTIQDLKKYPDVFQDEEDTSKGRIYGSPSGWEVDEILRAKVKAYGLDEQYNYFTPGSSSGLAVSLGTTYEKGEPWVGYYWEPEWIMAKYDVTLLEDQPFDESLWNEDAGYTCEWPSVDVTIAIHKDMTEKAPEVVEFLSNYKTSKDLNNTVLEYMQDNDTSAHETAEWFLKEYESLWTSWLPDDVVEKVKSSI